jgi:Ca2+-binding RTX toxin-like protein
MKRLLWTALLFAAVLAVPIQADFIQCVATVACSGSGNDDLVNGSPGVDRVQGLFGNDAIFGGASRDLLSGDEGNDQLFGGPGSDFLAGQVGNDTLIPGPDDADAIQNSSGLSGNDTFIVFVGETVNCQLILGQADFDVLHLIGFGPYLAEFPYGAPTPIADGSYIVIQDPIAGGYIFVRVESGQENLERINGLPSPNVSILESAAFTTFVGQNCID